MPLSIYANAFTFQSTPPVKAATKHIFKNPRRWHISIHAAREGGDRSVVYAVKIKRQFQSTPPVKAATKTAQHGRFLHGQFQSTPPVKAATPNNALKRQAAFISIHAAREGGDPLRIKKAR